MNSTERDNFVRNSILVNDNAREALVSLVDLDVQHKGQTFEQFVNTNQHEIYHLYNSRGRCCQCFPGYRPSCSSRILHQTQMDALFDRSSKLPCHIHFVTVKGSNDFCCSMARSGICTDVLDILLARYLLLTFCNDVFWFSCLQFQSLTLEDFLNHNKHELYHLWQNKVPCCECPPGYTFPTTHSVLTQRDWMEMFNAVILPCSNHRKRASIGGMHSICSVAAAPGITLNIDPTASSIILKHICPLWTSVETLVLIRNQHTHSIEGKMSDNDYNTSVVKIERCILDIAKVCNKETQLKQKLHATMHGDIVQRQNIQQQNLTETPTRQQDINQKYKMESTPRGFVLIINNIHFHNHEHRPGAQQDRDKLKAMFKDFGFQVDVKEDQTAGEIEDLLSAFSLQPDLHRVDSLIVVLMSHGNDEVILGTDCQRLNVISLIKKFNADYCPAMMGKPKMFIVNACRGDDVDCNPILGSTQPCFDKTETDAGPTSLERKQPANSDLLIAYSTFPGYVSFRDDEEGSWFIQCLEKVFRESASEEHVMDMLTQVNDKVASKSESMMGYNQTPAPSTTLRYKWFLNPLTV